MPGFRALAVVSLVAGAAHAINVIKPEELPRPVQRCGREETKLAQSALSSKSFSILRQSPCTSDMVHMYESFHADPDDAVEFLGGVQASANCTKKLLPKFLYLGMEHAGSTTLADALNNHTELSFGKCKEHRFWTKYGTNVFATNDDEYLNEFEVNCDVTMTFDATPNMFGLPLMRPAEGCHVLSGAHGGGEEGITAAKQLLGSDLRLIVMLRNPVKVLLSLYPWKTFEKNADRAVGFCECFAAGLELWQSHFPAAQFIFLQSDDLFEHPQETMDDVFRFLGVAPSEVANFAASGRRRTSAVSSGVYRKWVDYWNNVLPCQQRLANLTGLNLSWVPETY